MSPCFVSVVPYRAFAMGYIELFRGLPALVTLILLAFGLPITFGINTPGGRTGAAIMGLSIVAGAYMAETIRGGIEAVPRGQVEAARSLGMSRSQAMISIILPQAFRIMIPPLTNEMVLLIKDTSLLSLITVFELVAAGLQMNSERIVPTESFLTIAAGYLLITQVSSTSGPGVLVAGMVLQSIGFAPLYTLTNDLIIGAAAPERAGAAAGISETTSELGGALGIALLGSLATAVFGNAFARETLPQALELTAAVCTVLVIAMAAVIVTLLRRVPAPSGADGVAGP